MLAPDTATAFLPTSLSQWVGLIGGVCGIAAAVSAFIYRLGIKPLALEVVAREEAIRSDLNAVGEKVNELREGRTGFEARIFELEKAKEMEAFFRQAHSERMGALDRTLASIEAKLDQRIRDDHANDIGIAGRLAGLESNVSGLKESIDRLLEDRRP